MAEPLVSILINNYNYGQYLREAVDSALGQTYPRVEVIVVDDGSTDDSRAILTEYGDRIVSVLKSNGGQGSAFNAGLAASRGDIVCFLDADDRFHPDKVRLVVETLERHPEAGWLVHNYVKFKPDGSQEPVQLYRQSDTRNEVARAARGKSITYFPPTSALVFRRALLAQFFPVPEHLRITTDNYLKFVSASISPVHVLAQILTEQRLHGANLYTNLSLDALTQKRYHVDTGIGLALLERPTARNLGLGIYANGLANGLTSGQLGRRTLLERARAAAPSGTRQLWLLAKVGRSYLRLRSERSRA